ncbi:hypothetical protein ACIQUM_37405 [Amycolatopsis azurea]|uniref:hypothetical protein n=1 Tax=Amycolatopsis azurea TaxID=36819 RepID=UPI0037F1809E
MSDATPGDRGGTTPGYRVDFPVFTVTEWLGAKDLDFFQVDPSRQAVTEVWLGHAESTGEHTRILLAATLMESPGTTDDRRASAAFEAAIKLAGMRLPAEDDRPPGFRQRLVDHVQAETRSLDQWPVKTVSIDGEAVAVRVWQFVGGIVAVMDDPGTGPICCLVSYGMELDGLTLSTPDSLADYGIPATNVLSRDRLPDRPAISVLPKPPGYHRDFHALLTPTI